MIGANDRINFAMIGCGGEGNALHGLGDVGPRVGLTSAGQHRNQPSPAIRLLRNYPLRDTKGT